MDTGNDGSTAEVLMIQWTSATRATREPNANQPTRFRKFDLTYQPTSPGSYTLPSVHHLALRRLDTPEGRQRGAKCRTSRASAASRRASYSHVINQACLSLYL